MNRRRDSPTDLKGKITIKHGWSGLSAGAAPNRRSGMPIEGLPEPLSPARARESALIDKSDSRWLTAPISTTGSFRARVDAVRTRSGLIQTARRSCCGPPGRLGLQADPPAGERFCAAHALLPRTMSCFSRASASIISSCCAQQALTFPGLSIVDLWRGVAR